MAEPSLLYPKSESRNSAFRSREETQRTIDLLLTEVALLKDGVDRQRREDFEVRQHLIIAAVHFAQHVLATGAPDHAVKQMIVCLGPSDSNVLSHSEVDHLLFRLGLEGV